MLHHLKQSFIETPHSSEKAVTLLLGLKTEEEIHDSLKNEKEAKGGETNTIDLSETCNCKKSRCLKLV